MFEESGEEKSYLKNVSWRNQLAGKNTWDQEDGEGILDMILKSREKLNNVSLLNVHVSKISSAKNLLLQQKSFSSVNHIIILHPGV